MTDGDGTLRLRAVLEPRGPAAAIILSDDQLARLGPAKVLPVQVTVNGVTVPARVARMGGENLLGFSRKQRSDLGVETGQSIDLLIVPDTQPREAELPPELFAALMASPSAKTAFDALAPSHQKEFARWVAEAKREATTTSRVEQCLQMLREGRTRR